MIPETKNGVLKPLAQLTQVLSDNYALARTSAETHHREHMELLQKSHHLMLKEAEVLNAFIHGQRDFINQLSCQHQQPRALQGRIISHWLRELGYKAVKAVLCEVIDYYTRQVKMDDDKKLSADEIMTFADALIQRYPYSLRITEVIYLCHQGVTGRYGELYGRLDLNTLHKWLEQYLHHMDNHCAAEALAQKQDYGSNAAGSDISPETRERLSAIGRWMTDPKKRTGLYPVREESER